MSELTSNVYFKEVNYDINEILKGSEDLTEFPEDNLRYQGGLQELKH